jgi:Sir2 family
MSRERLREMIDQARRVAIFTGAGISTESGIPDFRSPGGVWSRMSPIYFQDFVASEAKRREAWDRAFSGRAGWTGKEPNAGHFGVARLIASGKARAVITQNVDNLHQHAGVPADQVIELHGNASYATCLECGLRHELADLKALYQATGDLPACRDCGGIVKTATSRSASRCRKSRWPSPRPRRWPATSSWCWARLWWSIRRTASRSWPRRTGRGSLSSTASPPTRTTPPTWCCTTRSAR